MEGFPAEPVTHDGRLVVPPPKTHTQLQASICDDGLGEDFTFTIHHYSGRSVRAEAWEATGKVIKARLDSSAYFYSIWNLQLQDVEKLDGDKVRFVSTPAGGFVQQPGWYVSTATLEALRVQKPEVRKRWKERVAGERRSELSKGGKE